MLLDNLRQLPNICFRTLFGNLHQVLYIQQNALNMLVLLASALADILPQRHSLTCNMLREYKSHTWRRNSRSIGVTLCCAKDAILAYKCNPVFGAYPPTELQVEQMAIVVAILCHELELEINNDTVLTHAEAASRDQYGPGQGDPDMRWDLYMLKGMPETRALRPGGVLLRKKALAYLHSMLRDKLLQPHEAEVE